MRATDVPQVEMATFNVRMTAALREELRALPNQSLFARSVLRAAMRLGYKVTLDGDVLDAQGKELYRNDQLELVGL